MALSLHIDRIDEQMNTLLEHGLAKSVNYDSGNMVKAKHLVLLSQHQSGATFWSKIYNQLFPYFLSRLQTGQNAFRVKS